MDEQKRLRDLVPALPDVLQATERRFRALLQNSDEMIAIFRPSGKIVYASPATLRWLGYADEEFVGRPALEFTHPDDQNKGRQLFERLGHSSEPITEEARIRHRDGSWRLLRGTFQNHTDDPAVGGIVSNYRDVTDARHAERAYRRLEEHAAFALDAARAGLWEVDLQTETITNSATMDSILGMPAHNVAGTGEAFRKLVHPDDLANISATIQRSIQTDAPYRVEYRLVRPDGAVRWIEARGRVTRDPNGQPLTMTGIAIDVTARKELEAQLQQSQKLEALGLLAGSVAHDFNNLLTIILGFTDLVLQTYDPEDPRAADIVQIQRASDQARDLIAQLLAFSRRQATTPAAVSVNEIVQNAEGILTQAVGKKIRVKLALAPQVGLIWVDQGQMNQVLVNLAVNARDAMPNGGELAIETHHVAAGSLSTVDGDRDRLRDTVTLTIRDTGVGMTPETQARIFEPFFTTKDPGKGTGLGLSTVYGIVRQSNGAISIESQVGHGTAFTISFPVVEV